MVDVCVCIKENLRMLLHIYNILGYILGFIGADHVLHCQISVPHKLFHEAHETLHHEAPIVAHRIPPPQEVRHVDELVNSD